MERLEGYREQVREALAGRCPLWLAFRASILSICFRRMLKYLPVLAGGAAVSVARYVADAAIMPFRRLVFNGNSQRLTSG
jgi:hypothetical protein